MSYSSGVRGGTGRGRADVVLLPYDSTEQVTSGVLAEADQHLERASSVEDELAERRR